ncbi:MAG: hypothetical protein IKM31_07365 [Oscillospiraceae bacterium]|nr:hypothetical protein [Oscillospiraceae bacterium]
MKKRLAVFLSLIIVVVLVGGTVMGFTEGGREPKQISYPTSTLNTALFRSDLVVEGTIVSVESAMQQNYQKKIGNGKYTSYKIQTDDIWFGECDAAEIDLIVDNDYSFLHLHEKDKAIFLLYESSSDENVYELTHYENSVFIKNPPFNRLFPLSPAESCMAYDGKTAGKLKSGMKKALRQLARKGVDIMQASGEVSASYKEKYRSKRPKEEQQ